MVETISFGIVSHFVEELAGPGIDGLPLWLHNQVESLGECGHHHHSHDDDCKISEGKVCPALLSLQKTCSCQKGTMAPLWVWIIKRN
jgi:hypothetical protein